MFAVVMAQLILEVKKPLTNIYTEKVLWSLSRMGLPIMLSQLVAVMLPKL